MASTGLAPLFGLFRDNGTRSLEATARIFFTNSALTINTLPAAIGVIAILGGLGIYLLLVNPFTFWNAMTDEAVDYMTSGDYGMAYAILENTYSDGDSKSAESGSRYQGYLRKRSVEQSDHPSQKEPEEAQNKSGAPVNNLAL